MRLMGNVGLEAGTPTISRSMIFLLRKYATVRDSLKVLSFHSQISLSIFFPLQKVDFLCCGETFCSNRRTSALHFYTFP